MSKHAVSKIVLTALNPDWQHLNIVTKQQKLTAETDFRMLAGSSHKSKQVSFLLSNYVWSQFTPATMRP